MLVFYENSQKKLLFKTFARQLTMFLLRHCKSVAPQRHCERTQ